jgi:hypothetical protein
MPEVSIPDHLPHPPRDAVAYEALYARIQDVDDFYWGDQPWYERRIPPGLPAAQVYRRLPTAPDFEYGGPVTRTRIRFRECGADSASLIHSKPCTFHTHPTEHPHANLPSDKNVYSFLRYRNLRTVMVGSSLLWVFDKTRSTLQTVERLNEWEQEHMLGTVRFTCSFAEYPSVVLQALGLRWPRSMRRRTEEWPAILRETLGIGVTVLPR